MGLQRRRHRRCGFSALMQACTFSPNQSKSQCNHPSGYLPVVSFFRDSGYFKTIFKSRVLFFPLTPPPKTNIHIALTCATVICGLGKSKVQKVCPTYRDKMQS